MSFMNLQSNDKCNYCIYSDFAKGCLKGLFLPFQLMITEKECQHYECDNEKLKEYPKENEHEKD